MSERPVLNLLCAGAAQGLVEALQGGFEAVSGAAVHTRFGAVGAMKEALLGGALCDVMVTSAAQLDELVRGGALRAGTALPLGRVSTGVAVRAGDPAPAIDTAAALRDALRAADRIYFPDAVRSTAGSHFSGVLKQLGIDEEVAARLATFPNGATAMRELAASTATAPVGCTQVTEIVRTAGICLVGPLPPALGLSTVYAAAISARVADPARAAAFVACLTGEPSRPARLAAGFELEAPTPSLSPSSGP